MQIIEVLLAALRWDMQQRRFGLTAVGLDKLHALSVELLEVLKENMPYRTGNPVSTPARKVFLVPLETG